MSSSGKGKNKRMNSKSGSKKNLGSNQSLLFEEAYGNQELVYVLLSLMGTKCQATVRNGGVYEGLLHTFNSKMDIKISAVHLCGSKSDSSANGIDEQKKNYPKEEELIEEMMFPAEKLVSLKFEDVDLNYGISDVNETNGEAMREQRTSVKQGEKKLEPWDGGGDSLDKDSIAIGGLEASGGDGTNGWDADDMFRANETIYGVKSDYDSSLSSYTMALDVQDPEKVARATRLAQEIESGTDYKKRIDLEVDDGTTEEDKFSAVIRDRRGPRDMRDRDGEHGGYRDKDKSWGDRDRDHPISPQGYRTGKHDGFERYRGRGRGRDRDRDRDTWMRGNPQGYPGSNMGQSRSMGPGAPMTGGGGRNQPPMSQMDGHPGQGGQGKHRNSSSSQLPPRFTKSGSGGYSRDGDGMRHQNENNAMHSTYSAPKGQRVNRKSSGGRMHSTEYTRHSPTQMYSDPAAPGGGPPLSRTSSSSSNASAPVQNHRKLLSTSSQEDQPTQIPSQQHHQHMRQSQSSSSPTGGPMVPNNQQSQQRQQTIPPTMPSQQQDAPTHSWADIARNPKPQMAAPASDISPMRMGQGLPQQSPGTNKIPPVVVNSNQKFSWAPSPGNTPYVQQGMQPQMQGNTASSPRMLQPTQVAMNRGQPQSVTNPSQRQQQQVQPQHYDVQMPPRPGQRMVQPNMKTPTGEPLKHDMDKTEDNKQIPKKMPDSSAVQNSSAGGAKSREGMKELREFKHNFKLASEVNKEAPGQAPSKTQQRPQNISQQQQQYPNPVPHQQGYPPQPQTYAASMGMSEHSPQVPHQMSGAQGTNQPMPPKHMQPPNQGMVIHHPQQMPQMTQQIPMASPSIQLFGAHSPVQASPRPMESPKSMGPRTPGGVQQKALTSPQTDVSNYPQGNVHVVTGPTVPQANPPAVISVSAATLSPIAPQLQAVTANAQQHQTQSPTPGQAAPVSSTPSVESAGNISSTTPSSSVTSPTSQSGKPLNPEALEFKPRTTPSKAAAARATTPLQQQGYVATAAAYQPQSMGGMTPQGHLMGPVYPPGTIDPMQPQMQQHVYSQFPPQQIILGQHVQQQMQQFSPFDQGQVYANPGNQPMMVQNARIPTGPQQHVQQYPSDQPPAVYVPVQSNFMQPQARPHSAHTPTQATHVTAASPAGQSAQQPPQPAGHPGPAMVPTHGGQQQVQPLFMVQAGQIPHQHQAQMAPQFINVPQVPMTSNVMPQQKGQQQPNQYMPTQPGRSYAPYPSQVPNTQ